MTIKELFEEMKTRIDKACELKDYKAVKSEELGFESEKINDGRLIHEQYKFEVANTDSIEIDFRCYDQSRAFSIQPDMNKFQMTWTKNNNTFETYQNYFED